MSSSVLSSVTLTRAADPAGRSATVFAVTPVPGSTGTVRTERPGTADAMAAIVSELSPRFAGRVPCEVIVQCVDQAVRDLHESTCMQALPEMAVRLAAVRLDRRIQQMADGRVSSPQPELPPGVVASA